MSKDTPYRAVVPPRRARLSDSIVEQIEQLIVSGELRPGHEMPPERLLAQQFGVSRPSLREALLRLESRGLLAVARGGGFMVTDVTAPTITDPLVHLLQRHDAAEQDILELRHGLELVAAHFAALRATKEDGERLRKAHLRLREAQSGDDSLLEAQCDADFHIAVAEASHNVALIHVMHGIHNLLRTSMRHAWDVMRREEGNSELIRKQHQALLDGILGGDADKARNAAHLHLNFVRETLLQMSPRPRGRRAAPSPMAPAAPSRMRGRGR